MEKYRIESCATNPDILTIHTTWNVRETPEMKDCLEIVWGVEDIDTFGVDKYSVQITKGGAFSFKVIQERISRVLDNLIELKKL